MGTIQKVGTQGFGLYPHMFLAPDGNLRTIGPQKVNSHIINTDHLVRCEHRSAAVPARVGGGHAAALGAGRADHAARAGRLRHRCEPDA